MKYLQVIFIFIFISYSDQYDKSISEFIRNIESTLIHTILRNCSKNFEVFFINPYTMSILADKLIPYINFVQYVDNKTIIYPFYDFTNEIIKYKHFNSKLSNVIIIPGHLQILMNEYYANLAKNLMNIKKVNVFILDLGFLVNNEYLIPILCAPIIGKALGDVLAKLYYNDVKSFHLIGFSLGVYTSAYTGRYYEKITGNKLDRITGLDPLKPCFDVTNPPLELLNRNDAKFVDVIHTASELYGLERQLGHVDFYPNGGYFQPHCGGLPLCDHKLSLTYFSESIFFDDFQAVECENWDLFLNSHCANNTRSKMGYFTSLNARGKFFLKVNPSMPFGLGENGIIKP